MDWCFKSWSQSLYNQSCDNKTLLKLYQCLILCHIDCWNLESVSTEKVVFVMKVIVHCSSAISEYCNSLDIYPLEVKKESLDSSHNKYQSSNARTEPRLGPLRKYLRLGRDCPW